MTFPCIKCKIHKYTITQIRKYTNTKCLKDPTCAIFLKSMGLKDIKYDILVCQIHYIYITSAMSFHTHWPLSFTTLAEQTPAGCQLRLHRQKPRPMSMPPRSP